MSFDWQRWIEKFIAFPGYNDSDAKISEAINPRYKVIGIHRLTPGEDNARQCVYVDVLGANGERQMGAELEYNSGVSDPTTVLINRPSDEIVYFPFSGIESINIWHPEGEGVIGLRYEYSYLVVFQEVPLETTEKNNANLGGIQVTVNQEWIAKLKPDSLGNVTFFVDIK